MRHILVILMLISLINCQQQQKNTKRFDKKSLTDHYKTKNFNLLILLDQRIQNEDDGGLLDKNLKNFLITTLDNNRSRILIAGVDGNPPHFFLSSQPNELPTDYSSLFYSVDKLDLKKFERRYNPNISILKSIKELIINYSYKDFFIPNQDFMVLILTTQDDENYLVNMQGQKYQDKLEDDIAGLLELPQSQWNLGKGAKQVFNFSQLRLFVVAPTQNCLKNFKSADKLFFATSKINAHFTNEKDNWKRESENYNLCNLNFQNYFNQIYQTIEMRYEYKLTPIEDETI